MRKRKSVRVYSLVTALLLTLLLSLLIGIVVAPKPDSPGKSVKTWDIKIWIGVGDLKDPEDEDIVLLSPIQEDGDIYLVAEDVTCSGNLWDIPKKKGRGRARGSLIAQVNLFEPYGDDCGTYQLPTNGLEPEDEDIGYVSIGHTVTLMGNDFWRFDIQWLVEIEPQVYKVFVLEACTDPLPIADWDPEPEGELIDEEWFVSFDEQEGAEAILYSDWTDEDSDGVPDNLIWRGLVSFTVRITRSPH